VRWTRATESPAPTATITLTDAVCVADGLGALVSERFAATLVNQTSSQAIFNIQRLLDLHAYGELEVHIAEQQRRYAAGVQPLGPPSFTNVVSVTTVDSLRSSTVSQTLFSGTYGLVCRRVPTSLVREAAYLIGPFRVP
jgi:hypothetical protein